MVQLELFHSYTRFDKNLAHNAIDFSKYGEDEQLIKAILIYIAKTYQKNATQFGYLDPYDFCAFSGFNISELNRTLPESNIAQLKREKADTIPYLMKSKLENALYRMTDEPLRLSYQGKTYLDGEEFMIESILLLRKVTVRVNKYNKRTYNYLPGSEFINNLSKYFVHLEDSAFKLLKKRKLESLYLYLADLRETVRVKGMEIATPNFSLLCKLSNNHISRKAGQKQALKEDLEYLSENTKLKYSILHWGKSGFEPVICFADRLPLDKSTLKAISTNVFLNFFCHILLERYRIYYFIVPGNKPPLTPQAWYENTLLNRKEKMEAFLDAQRLVVKNPERHLSKEQVLHYLFRPEIIQQVCEHIGPDAFHDPKEVKVFQI